MDLHYDGFQLAAQFFQTQDPSFFFFLPLFPPQEALLEYKGREGCHLAHGPRNQFSLSFCSPPTLMEIKGKLRATCLRTVVPQLVCLSFLPPYSFFSKLQEPLGKDTWYLPLPRRDKVLFWGSKAGSHTPSNLLSTLSLSPLFIADLWSGER